MSLDLSLNYPDFKFVMENDGRNGIYEFDRFRLDTEKLMLYRDGIEVSLPPKMVKTLSVLVENRGTILSKDELIDQVWSDAIVDESNLSQHLHHLRKILGTHADGKPYIETLRRRGYRFNGDVRKPDPPKQEQRVVVEPSPSIRTAGVEREGNVLRVVDWSPSPSRQEIDRPVSVEHVAERGPRATSSSRRSIVAIVAVALLALTSIAIILKFRTSDVQQAAANTEISIVRLTNGSAPESATISPNGDYFVYHERAEDGERLWLQQVGHSNRVKIGDAPKGMVYGSKTFSPDGKFLFLSMFEVASGKVSLYRMPAIGGPHVKLLEDVEYPVSFSPDGKELVFIREDKSTRTTFLAIADKEGASQRTLIRRSDQARLVGSPAWSPDGKAIVFASVDPDNSTAIYATDPAGSEPRKISNERWDNAYRIAWLPDGRGLVMVATRIGESYTTRRNQIYLLTYPDGTSRRLTSDGNRYQESSLGVSNDEAIIALPVDRSSQIWSLASTGASSTAIQITRGQADGRAGLAPLPDGRVGFVSRVGEELGIWLMNADGSGLKQLSTGTLPVVEEVRADPKGRYLVFSGHKDGYSALYRYEVEGDTLSQLTFDKNQPVDSAVSADGTSVLYHTAIEDGMLHPARLFTIPMDGGKPQRFSEVECATPNYSPAGDKVSCIRGDDIVILSAADGSLIKTYRLLPYARVNFGARWTPDGKGVVYTRSERGSGNLWVQPLDGGSAKPLTDFAFGDIYHFAFSSDGTRLLVARGQQVSDAILIRNFR